MFNTGPPWYLIGLKTDCPVKTIKIEELLSQIEIERVDDVVPVGSYNWSPLSTAQKPEIVVPGAPRKLLQWKSSESEKLKHDSKVAQKRLIDWNRFMLPKYPLEPLFAAVEICQKQNENKFNFQAFDLVTDTRNLREILGFLKGRNNPFRIDIERIGKLVCFIQKCEAVYEHTADWKHTYRLDFKRKVSKPLSNRWSSGPHFQIGSVSFGDMKLLVRYKVHCADYEKSHISEEDVGSWPMVSALDSAQSNLKCYYWGPKITNCHNVYLAAKYKGRPFSEIIWPDLHFRNISAVTVAWHSSGTIDLKHSYSPATVTQPETYKGVWNYDFGFAAEKSGNFPKETMTKLCALLREIVDFVCDNEESCKWALVYEPNEEEENCLKLFRRHFRTYSAVPKNYKSIILNEI